ncbi:MAG: T9SS type A sorting domain-containing protein [Bacteroidia bacterium]|nr:T9SS type A sorting domain-containing protein [Bacteroidia bacterium]
MKRLAFLGLVVGLAYPLYGQCNLCPVSNNLPPRTFDPAFLVIEAGRDTDVVIQFALPETVSAPAPINYVYPNFAIYVDSLRMDGGNTYVSLAGNPSIAPAYNTSNPAAGAMRFDQNHRYKQVRSSSPTHDNVVVYRNPGGGGPSNPTPPRGCVRACIRGITPTPTADTLRIYLRGFVDPNSINIFTGASNDINNKDTSNLMPNLAGQPLYSDTWTSYAVVVRSPVTGVSYQALTSLQAYPNPTWGPVTVHYSLSRPANLTLTVLSLSGQQILHEKVGIRPAGENQFSLSLPPGIYLIELHGEGETLRGRVVVLH